MLDSGAYKAGPCLSSLVIYNCGQEWKARTSGDEDHWD